MVERKRNAVALLCGLAWVGAISAGFRVLQRHQTTAGARAEAPERWPANGPVARRPGRASLIMLAHSRCPCTRASIGELAWIMARAGKGLDAHVFFAVPDGFPTGWEKSDLWRGAASIPGVAVHGDRAGAAAGAFRATTSGQVLLYDEAGRLRFNGGITGSRGHAGGNPGRDALLSLLSDPRAARGSFRVFGCSLVDAARKTEEKGAPWKL